LALQRGEVDLHFTAANTAAALIQSEKVKAIAVVSDARLEGLPTVPTLAEAGLPQLKYDGWFGLLAPAKTPPAVREKIYADVNRVLAQPDVRAALQSQGFVVRSSGPAPFGAAIKLDFERYARLFTNAAR
jgi:tripartite-type tricarboxylate transporter receptor subunit TctC